MWQEILITDLTQMRDGRVCIAGINRNRETIRPVLPPPGIYEKHLYRRHAVLLYPRVVAKMCLKPVPKPEPPHIEDHIWEQPSETLYLRELDLEEFTPILTQLTYDSVESSFEAEIHRNKNFKLGTPVRSLGAIQPISIDNFAFDQFAPNNQKPEYRYRLSFTDATGQVFDDIPITDLTFRYFVHYSLQNGNPRNHSQQILAALQEVESIWLRLGIGRNYEGWHWLQINGIFTVPDYLDGKNFEDFRNLNIIV